MNLEIQSLLDERQMGNVRPAKDESDRDTVKMMLDMEALDQYLKVQGWRREEERQFRNFLLGSKRTGLSTAMMCASMALLMVPSFAFAGDPVTIIQNFANVLLGKILTTIALIFLGIGIVKWIKGEPNAKEGLMTAAFGSACLIGISGVWRFIQTQAT